MAESREDNQEKAPGIPDLASQAPPTELPAPPEETASGKSSLFHPDDSSKNKDEQSVSWTAAEFHVHDKSIGWYLILAVATIVVAAGLYLLMRTIVTPLVIVISGVVLGIYGTHRPNELEYAVNSQGVQVGTKQYPYDEFRLFVVLPESSTLPEITLIPTKRFMPSLSIRYTPDVENRVLDILSNHLPFEERRPDLIDSLMRRMRF